MAGLGHVAFREVLSAFGGYGFMVTEMCNARAVPAESRHHSSVFRWRDEEAGQLVCQIFGGEPAVMAEAARRIESEGFLGGGHQHGLFRGRHLQEGLWRGIA
jgi:tRNA-dihydrouridine synthase